MELSPRRTLIRGPCWMRKGDDMKKTLMALAAIATLAISAVAPAPAQAQRGVAAGVAAGLIGGAIVGSALAGPGYYYGPGHSYGPRYGYYGGPAHVAAHFYCGLGLATHRF